MFIYDVLVVVYFCILVFEVILRIERFDIVKYVGKD